MIHHIDTAATGAIGMSAPLAAAAISLDPMIDLELRIASMVIGIFVGLAEHRQGKSKRHQSCKRNPRVHHRASSNVSAPSQLSR